MDWYNNWNGYNIVKTRIFGRFHKILFPSESLFTECRKVDIFKSLFDIKGYGDNSMSTFIFCFIIYSRKQ